MRRRTSSLSMLWIPESAVAHISSCAALPAIAPFLAPLSHVPCKCVDCFNAAGAWLMYRQAPLTNHRALGWERRGARGSSTERGSAGVHRGRGAWVSGDMLCPAPPPLFPSSYANSQASAPAAEPKGPGGRGACGEPRGARRQGLRRQGEETKSKERRASTSAHRPVPSP